nr:hypothetical protein [Tanacetum cinerariifolium]
MGSAVVMVGCGGVGGGGSGCCHGGGRQRPVVVLLVVDLEDRATRSKFGVRRKISPEKFSGSGGWPEVVACRRLLVGEGERNLGAAVVVVPSSDRHHDGGLATDSPYSSNKSNQSSTKLNISQYGRCNHHAWKSKHEIGGCIRPIAVVVANLPSTARHGGGSGWKSRRCGCCGGVNSGVVVYGSWRLWAATKVAAGCHGDDEGGGLGVQGEAALVVPAAMVVPVVKAGQRRSWWWWVE